MHSIAAFFPADRTGTVQAVLRQNALCEKYGLSLTQAEAESIAEIHAVSLRENRLVEIGAGSVEKIVAAFADSPYVHRGNFAGVVEMMTEAFCQLKRDAEREVSDATLIAAMRAMFDDGSQGTEELFLGRDLALILRAVRGDTILADADPGHGERREILRRFFGADRLPEGEVYEPEVWEETYDVGLDDL